MNKFFGDEVILGNTTAVKLYKEVKNLPIIDYHCHLSPKQLSENISFENIGQLWLEGDHYKWRVMRICGVDEKYITGDATFYEKFMELARIMPMIVGNAVYYWANFELKQIFGINKPLDSKSADEIWNKCNEKLKDINVSTILNQFNVEFVATTDDPIDNLEYHGVIAKTIVTPTFRPDKAFSLVDDYYKKLSIVSGIEINSVDDLIRALEIRFDYFITKGCKISDHGLGAIPEFCEIKEAREIFNNRNNGLSDSQKEKFVGFMLTEMARMCKKRNVVMQWHFSALRNINSIMANKIGVDSGFDVFGDVIIAKNLTNLFDYLNKNGNLPKVILYTLNPNAEKLICTISGAFPNVRIGTAWWFNDTLEGTRQHIKTVMEYAVLGVHLGMLTDSRSFTSYVRHDFFRRILANEIGSLVEKGEYDYSNAVVLMKNISYYNIKNYLGV
ncbi:MAG: glucuronate isomerase [Clostridia bacterium]